MVPLARDVAAKLQALAAGTALVRAELGGRLRRLAQGPIRNNSLIFNE